jgi:hypothetical protein
MAVPRSYFLACGLAALSLSQTCGADERSLKARSLAPEAEPPKATRSDYATEAVELEVDITGIFTRQV